MTRSLFKPHDIDGSIRRLSTGKGPAFSILVKYLTHPENPQLIRPTTSEWFLKNLRSDLSSWRTALAQVPPGRLLAIPWLCLIAETRPDLVGKSDQLKTTILMENIRLYTTLLRPEGLHIGSYSALDTKFNPPLALVTEAQLAPQEPAFEEPSFEDPSFEEPSFPPPRHERVRERSREVLSKYFPPANERPIPFADMPDAEPELDDYERLLAEQKQLQTELLNLEAQGRKPYKTIEKIEARLAKIDEHLSAFK